MTKVDQALFTENASKLTKLKAILIVIRIFILNLIIFKIKNEKF